MTHETNPFPVKTKDGGEILAVSAERTMIGVIFTDTEGKQWIRNSPRTAVEPLEEVELDDEPEAEGPSEEQMAAAEAKVAEQPTAPEAEAPSEEEPTSEGETE